VEEGEAAAYLAGLDEDPRLIQLAELLLKGTCFGVSRASSAFFAVCPPGAETRRLLHACVCGGGATRWTVMPPPPPHTHTHQAHLHRGRLDMGEVKCLTRHQE
jgi:hypothetical protein